MKKQSKSKPAQPPLKDNKNTTVADKKPKEESVQPSKVEKEGEIKALQKMKEEMGISEFLETKFKEVVEEGLREIVHKRP